jgi:hypothetical protein
MLVGGLGGIIAKLLYLTRPESKPTLDLQEPHA